MMEAAPGTVLDLIFPFTFFSFHFQHYFHTILICIRIYRPQASYPENLHLTLIHFLHSPIIPLFKLMEELFRPDYNWTWFISVSVKSVIGIKILPGSPCLFGFGVEFFSLFGLSVSWPGDSRDTVVLLGSDRCRLSTCVRKSTPLLL